MREGEIVDAAAVTAAIQRLWKELSLRKGEVRVGVASPRVLVRTVDLPVMSEVDLAGALRFQAQELIPIPLDEAVLDFQVLEELPVGEPAADGTPPAQMQRILLAAAHRETVANLVGAVQAAGLTVAAVDLVPLALIRAIGRRVSDNGPGAEAIVSVGGGVTVMVAHEAGLPRFVRILGLGGRLLTEAIARDLEIPFDQAEALKRQTEPDAPAGRGARGRDGAAARGPRRADPRIARLLPRAAGRAAAAAGHAHRWRVAHARALRAARRARRVARRAGDAAGAAPRSATSGSRPTGSRTSTRTSRRRPGSRSAGSRPVGGSTSSAARAARRRPRSG